ncbi:ATJ20 [Symbiodinium sp. CCMP2456]|nr:ATJ20 [Symbiodinium sp. CCMP2456]
MSLGQDKPLAESVAAPEAKEEDEESRTTDLPLEELAKSEGSGEAETVEPVAEQGGSMEVDTAAAEDDDSSVEQSVTVRLPVTRVGGEEEEEFLKKAAISQMESARLQEKGKGKGYGKGHGKSQKGGKDGKGKSKDGKGKSGKGKAGKGKGRKGGKH